MCDWCDGDDAVLLVCGVESCGGLNLASASRGFREVEYVFHHFGEKRVIDAVFDIFILKEGNK